MALLLRATQGPWQLVLDTRLRLVALGQAEGLPWDAALRPPADAPVTSPGRGTALAAGVIGGTAGCGT